MFGQYYAKRDLDLQQGERSQLDYARELLAETYDRARILETAFLGVFYLEATDPLRAEMVDRFLNACRMYFQDVDEAVIRGRRAGLFTEGWLGAVDDASEERQPEEIGGMLVPTPLAERRLELAKEA